MTTTDASLRTHLAKLLDWREAHAGFDAAIDGIPAEMRGVVPDGWEYSAWQLLEHVRLAQQDILEFCIDAAYKEKKWPDDYWPRDPAPASEAQWTEAIASYHRDRDVLRQLAQNPAVDLFATIPHGSGQTYLRELLLVADHTSYHAGQIVALRRCLGIWRAK